MKSRFTQAVIFAAAAALSGFWFRRLNLGMVIALEWICLRSSFSITVTMLLLNLFLLIYLLYLSCSII